MKQRWQLGPMLKTLSTLHVLFRTILRVIWVITEILQMQKLCLEGYVKGVPRTTDRFDLLEGLTD